MSHSDDMIDTNEMNSFTLIIQKNEPPRKRFKHFNLVRNLVEQDENSASPVTPPWDGNKEIEKILTVSTVKKKWHWVLWRNDIEEWTFLEMTLDLYLLLFSVASGILWTPA